jgi:hypothetical protein
MTASLPEQFAPIIPPLEPGATPASVPPKTLYSYLPSLSHLAPWARPRDIHSVEQVATAECNLEGRIIHAVGKERRVRT